MFSQQMGTTRGIDMTACLYRLFRFDVVVGAIRVIFLVHRPRVMFRVHRPRILRSCREDPSRDSTAAC